MSEALHRDRKLERTARVWQSADFLRAEGPVPTFQPSAWRLEKEPQFGVRAYGQDRVDDESAEPNAELEGLQGLEPESSDVQPPAADVLALPAAPTEPQAQWAAQDMEQIRLQAYEEGRLQGLQEAGEQSRAELVQWQAEQARHLEALERSVKQLLDPPDQLHEPLKRLALHLAEQLVLGELSVSAQAVDRLVQRCVDELGAQRGSPVLIELHPDDLPAMQEWLQGLSADAATPDEQKKPSPWTLQANASLMPGSVRASANDAMVSDLVENRLDDLARQLLTVPQKARRQSAFQGERLAARRADVSQVLDAQPRMSDSPRSARFGQVIEAPAEPVDPPH